MRLQRGVRDFRRRNLRAFHLRIRFAETSRRESGNRIPDRPRVIHGLALNEILHRIGGDQAGVVAGGVGGPERVAIDQHLDVRAEHRALPSRASRRRDSAGMHHIAFAVITPFPSAGKLLHGFPLNSKCLRAGIPRSGKPASSASRNSSSGTTDTRRSSASRISCLVLPFTANKNGNPNFSR